MPEHYTIDISDPADPLKMLSACPVHAQTPMQSLDLLAQELGWSALYAKDETSRMGLGSFKALGGTYAVLKLVIEKLRVVLGREPDVDDIRDAKGTSDLQTMMVCCASAGNHGLSVAAGANIFGVACEVYLADTVPESFAERLRAKNATVIRAGKIYEDAMAAAKRRAEDDDVTLVSDASWEGEMRIPSLVMQGYAVMSEEIKEHFSSKNEWPTHVALQAGVGGIAASVAAHIRRTWPHQPEILVIEPDRAACLKKSHEAGKPVRADGAVSNMGRLDCKEVSLRAFDELQKAADRFVTVTDQDAQTAVETLARHGMHTTPSGAAGLAGLVQANMPQDARAMILVTEGNMG